MTKKNVCILHAFTMKEFTTQVETALAAGWDYDGQPFMRNGEFMLLMHLR